MIKTMIEIKKLSKNFGDQKVVHNVNLSLPKGKIFGFLGQNGAVKTTVMKMVVGVLKPDSGSIVIDKQNINKKEIKEIIGYMPEDPYFYDHLSALEFMKFVQDLFKRKSPLKIETILSLTSLGTTGKKRIVNFSKGMKQRLGLAQALVNNPEYLFLDEPLDGLDPIGRKEFKEIILNLRKQGKTIFFNSHILSDVEEICDQIGIIDEGKLIYSGTVNKFRGKKSLENAFVEIIEKENRK
jgi:ABC-2 type transport system ATP-binding protein